MTKLIASQRSVRDSVSFIVRINRRHELVSDCSPDSFRASAAISVESVLFELSQCFFEVMSVVGIAREYRLLPRSVLEREIDDRAFGQRHGFSQAAIVGDVCAGFEFDKLIHSLVCSEALYVRSFQRTGGQRVECIHYTCLWAVSPKHSRLE